MTGTKDKAVGTEAIYLNYSLSSHCLEKLNRLISFGLRYQMSYENACKMDSSRMLSSATGLVPYHI